MSPEQNRYESLRSVVQQMQAEHIAMKCLIPALLGSAAVRSGKEPQDFIREVHGVVAASLERHIIGDDEKTAALRERAISALDTIVTAARIAKVDD